MKANWREIVVAPSTPAEEALRILDLGGQRVVLVADTEHRLVGMLTDGDVRRAILRHINFGAAIVSEIMNVAPQVARVGTSRETLRAFLEKNSLLHVPLVDSDGHLVGMETYSDVIQNVKRENWVFLMAGGMGTRLRPLTDTCPKPMLAVGGKPILESILERFISAGFHNFYISVNYLADSIKDYFGNGSNWCVSIKYVEETVPLGTGGSLGLLPQIGDKPIIMMNGDIQTSLDFHALLDFHGAQHAQLTVSVREYEMQVPYGVVNGESSRVVGIIEKPVHRFFVNAGIYVVSQAIIESLRPAQRLDMPDLVKSVLANGEVVGMFPIREHWIDIGRPEDFERAQGGS
jgi:dTDP-glucose pyrophosphorylase/CBS domain-containing protein